MSENYKDIITILGHEIPLGTSKEINFNIAKLHTSTKIDVPVIIERSKKPGPTILFTAGIHGDEINGVDIVRQLISRKINKPKRGTIICMPIINIFGFLNASRDFPDGRDLNRVFPGSANGSLASRVAYRLVKEVIPNVDLVVDFHTGGASRYNAAQIRIVKNQPKLDKLAAVFGAPFVLYSNHISKSFRNACFQLGKPILLFEGGKSSFIDNHISDVGLEGVKRVLAHFQMLDKNFEASPIETPSIYIDSSKWLRAKRSGMFKSSVEINTKIKVGSILGQITDPYGKIHHTVKSNANGYIINVNEAVLVYQGDALFHIATDVIK
ncbi:succinylglutamate desuccinylase [Aquaticitalea lipolytica]|uniref:Succinylglutamate desuccinylase n=1 Tax=Aquaticitalea lipolytica TaxID=1247562 RepID=A0A8J2TNZ2_9FLAO|nr:succinylglutamate desuccinylase/aspartoacylase family protein [Aquaticitalea lipolytica]GFZ82605.1 succinylglutamate desuccinylase [Aquaticitalea lipolytica]